MLVIGILDIAMAVLVFMVKFIVSSDGSGLNGGCWVCWMLGLLDVGYYDNSDR